MKTYVYRGPRALWWWWEGVRRSDTRCGNRLRSSPSRSQGRCLHVKYLISLLDGSPLRSLLSALVHLGALNEVSGWGPCISLSKSPLNTYEAPGLGRAKEAGSVFGVTFVSS